MLLFRRHPWWKLLGRRHLREGAHYFEGIPGGDNYSDGNEEDCDSTDDKEWKLKGIQSLIPNLIEATRRFIIGKDQGKDGSMQPPKVQQEQPKESLEAGQEGD